VPLSHSSRILPQKAWAASIPTLLSYEAFDTLMSPNIMQGNVCAVSPLERFLGCAYLRKNLPRIIQAEEEVIKNVLYHPQCKKKVNRNTLRLNFCRMSQDVGKLRCLIAQVLLYSKFTPFYHYDI
jgi:hypothetical protein